jgi:hypothetical protein
LQCYSPPCYLRNDFIWACGCIFYFCCCHVYLPAAGLQAEGSIATGTTPEDGQGY